jgi:hypothetical protein
MKTKIWQSYILCENDLVPAYPVCAISFSLRFHVLCDGILYKVEQRAVLVRLYCATGLFKQRQANFRHSFRTVATSNSVVQKMVRKLETKETLQNKYGEDGLQ